MSKVLPCPEGMRWVSPYLTVKDINAAVEFYQKVFGFEVRTLMRDKQENIMHAELQHKDSVIMLGPECPEAKSRSALALGGTPVTLYTYVENVDELFARAKAAGVTVIEELKDQFWGDRCCLFTDPEGHSWMFATHIRDVSPEEISCNK